MKWPFVFLSLISFSTNAQSVFAPLGAVWYFESGSITASGYERIEVVGDKLLGGFSARRLAVSGFQTQYWNPDWEPSDGWITFELEEVLRSSSDSTYRWESASQSWTLLFDYGASIGDEIDQGGDLISDILVVDTGLVQINGMPLKTWQTVTTDASELASDGEWIERIGNVNRLWPFWSNEADDSWKHYQLNCYFDEEIGSVLLNDDGGCEEELSVDDEWPHNVLYPNPTDGLIHLPNSEPGELVSLFSSFGQLQHQQPVPLNRSIDLSTLPKGIYLLLLRGESMRILLH